MPWQPMTKGEKEQVKKRDAIHPDWDIPDGATVVPIEKRNDLSGLINHIDPLPQSLHNIIAAAPADRNPPLPDPFDDEENESDSDPALMQVDLSGVDEGMNQADSADAMAEEADTGTQIHDEAMMSGALQPEQDDVMAYVLEPTSDHGPKEWEGQSVVSSRWAHKRARVESSSESDSDVAYAPTILVPPPVSTPSRPQTVVQQPSADHGVDLINGITQSYPEVDLTVRRTGMKINAALEGLSVEERMNLINQKIRENMAAPSLPSALRSIENFERALVLDEDLVFGGGGYVATEYHRLFTAKPSCPCELADLFYLMALCRVKRREKPWGYGGE